MNMLNERQLEIMRASYPGFKEKDAVVRHTLAEQKRYKATPGYIPPKQYETDKIVQKELQ